MGKLGVVALLLVLVSCSSVDKALVGSGESLKAVGENYLSANAVFVAKCPTGQISKATCDTYRAFVPKFKLSYPLAMQLFEVGRRSSDRAATDNATQAILNLGAELAVIALQAGVSFSK